MCEAPHHTSSDSTETNPSVREVHCWAPDIELSLHPEAAAVDVEAVADGYRVTVVAARGLVKDLTLFVDRLDPQATVDQSLVTLPAGASATLHVCSSVAGLEAALTTAPVLRTANDLARTRAAVERPAMV